MNSKLYRWRKKRVKKTTGVALGDSLPTPGTLYIVSGPIGNLEDITIRALRVLKKVSIVAAEDTRSTQRLLRRYGLQATLTTYDHQNHREKAEILIDQLRRKHDVALVSDCGTPVIYDPGSWLVRRAVDEGISVRPIPGPSVPIAALAVAGVSGDAFLFQGSLPKSQKRLRQFFRSMKRDRRTMVFFVSVTRFLPIMRLMGALWGNRQVLVAANLTTKSERLIWRQTSQLARIQDLPRQDANLTVVVEGYRGRAKSK